MSMKHDNNKNLNPLSRKALRVSGGGAKPQKINDLAVYNIEQSIAPLKQIRLTALDKMRVVGWAYLPNTLKWSDSEHTQSSQTCKDERFRMTNFLSRSVKKLRRKPCAALPLWLITDSLYLRTKFSLSKNSARKVPVARFE